MKTGGIRQLTGRISFALKGGVFVCALLSHVLALPACAAPDATPAAPQRPAASVANDGFNDGIDRSDPNFVTASLLIMSPGDELYSCAGHACIRLECPTYNLDYCFSYESESVKEKVLTFFMGKLKMGMFAIPTEDYLKLGRESGRGVMQYRLNLPPDVKQRLWKILDDKVAEGANLPYDHLKRGCAQTILVLLREALKPRMLEVPPWPDFYKKTQREVVDYSISPRLYPWQRFFLTGICGIEVDKNVPPSEKIMTPEVLLGFLRTVKVSGSPIIDNVGVELLPAKPLASGPLVTPFAVSWFFVGLAVADVFLHCRGIDILFLSIQSIVGLFYTFLVFFSDLPATSWHWLIVPFNLLPLLFWKWRWKWALWFAVVLVLWECGMVLYPHRLTDSAYLVLVVAYIGMYARIGWPQRLRQRT